MKKKKFFVACHPELSAMSSLRGVYFGKKHSSVPIPFTKLTAISAIKLRKCDCRYPKSVYNAGK